MTPSTIQEKFILYIDILGFSALIEKDPRNSHRIYRLIEELHAHNDQYFQTIVFSDTILIYNTKDALYRPARESLVMLMIEFAVDLFYRFAGKRYYFRALLTHGELEHRNGRNFDRIFGGALISAYRQEKAIQAIGLFIDDFCQDFNIVYRTSPYQYGLHFVYLNQALDRFYAHEIWPARAYELINFDYPERLTADVAFLKDINSHMASHHDPRVREKMRRTWEFYREAYPRLLQDLVANSFDLRTLSEDLDWRPYTSELNYGHRGFGIEPPVPEEFSRVVEEARAKGRDAAAAELRKIYGDHQPGEMFYAPCGGAELILDIDGRSRLGRFLVSINSQIDGFMAQRRRDGLHISIQGMHHYQERDVNLAAETAALSVLQERLQVEGLVKAFYD